LQEYFVTVTPKLQVDVRVARQKVEWLAEFHVVASEVADMLAAIDLHCLHEISFWNAPIADRPNDPDARFCSPTICNTERDGWNSECESVPGAMSRLNQ
jgi:hypothetical protein